MPPSAAHRPFHPSRGDRAPAECDPLHQDQVDRDLYTLRGSSGSATSRAPQLPQSRSTASSTPQSSAGSCSSPPRPAASRSSGRPPAAGPRRLREDRLPHLAPRRHALVAHQRQRHGEPEDVDGAAHALHAHPVLALADALAGAGVHRRVRRAGGAASAESRTGLTAPKQERRVSELLHIGGEYRSAYLASGSSRQTRA